MKFLIFLLPLFIFAEIIKFNNLKNEYFYNQLVNLKGKIILQKDINLTSISTEQTEVNLTKTNPYIYQIDIKFKANDKPHKIFLIGYKFYKEIDLNNLIKIKKINAPKNFSNIYAKEFKIINPIASKYDENHTILSFTIKCKECNIEDFNLSNEQNLTLINKNEATYYILLPKNLKFFTFFYFDLNSSTLKKIKIPINLNQKTISTQTDVNPEENTFFTPINILILSIIAFLLVIFLIYQYIWILIFPLFLTGYLIYTIFPKGEIFLPRNTKVQILPTPQSTIIYITPNAQKAKILKKLKKYTKIKINNKIGWVKNEDIK